MRVVAGTFKHLKDNDFVLGHSNFTVISTVRKLRLGAIGGNRTRKAYQRWQTIRRE
jgi:hypothetical protein